MHPRGQLMHRRPLRAGRTAGRTPRPRRYSEGQLLLSEGPLSRGLGHISRACILDARSRPHLRARQAPSKAPADVWSLRVP